MSSIRDHLADFPWHARKLAVRLSNARYRATRPLRTASGRYRTSRNRRAVARGRRPLAERAGTQVGSRTPLYRSRINPVTGRPHRDDARQGRLTDESLRRLRQAHAQRLMPGTEAWERGPDVYRSMPVPQRTRVRSR